MNRKKLSKILPVSVFRKTIENFRNVRVVVAGDIILDKVVWGEVKRISPEAPVPIVEVSKEDFTLGGAGNVAANIQSLSGKAFLVGVVGNDENGKIVREEIAKKKIESSILTNEGIPTITKTRIIAKTQQLVQQLVRIDREEKKPLSGSHLRAIRQIINSLKSFQSILISDYGKGFITPSVIRIMRDFSKKYNKVLTVDPKIEHFSYYKGVCCITPNRFEASAGMHSPEPEDMEKVIHLGRRIQKRLNCDNLLLTLGKEGMVLFDCSGGIFHIPAAAREVFDGTGAGDTVIASLTLALSTGAGVLESAIISNCAAGVVVGKIGTATVTLQELTDFFKDNYSSVYVDILN